LAQVAQDITVSSSLFSWISQRKYIT